MNDTAERWLPIPGYEGRYDVSDLGRVRSWLTYHTPIPPPRILKSRLDDKGYLGVCLRRDGRTDQWKNHLLVLLAFVGPLPKGLETRHLNGDRANNVLTNIVYGTSAENTQDSLRHGTHSEASRTHCKHRHPFNEANTSVSKSGRHHRGCKACMRDSKARYLDKNRPTQKGMI